MRRPSEPGGQLPAVEFREWTDPVYRIQDDDRISSRRYPKPRYRFDAPGGEYAVLYANDTKVATFNESYAEKRRHGIYPRFRGSIERSRRGGTEIVGEYCPSGLLVVLGFWEHKLLARQSGPHQPGHDLHHPVPAVLVLQVGH